MSSWLDTAERPLDAANLALLLDNKIAAIRIPGFASADECARFAHAAKHGALQYYKVREKIGYIGLAQYQYRWDKTKADFFADVAAAQADVQAVCEQARFDPLARLLEHLRPLWPAPIGLAEEAGQDYFAGIIRCTIDKIDLHADWAPLNSPDYAIAAIDGQLGWNFFAEQLLSGGQTTVYHNPWQPQAEPGVIAPSYGLSRSLTEGVPQITYEATAGDVVIFNTRNPHEIAPGTPRPGGARISMGSFIGRMPDRSLVLWA